MINTDKLNLKIKEKGITKTFIAANCGITLQCFFNKLNNVSEFTLKEAKIISDILGLNRSQFFDIFFANNMTKCRN